MTHIVNCSPCSPSLTHWKTALRRPYFFFSSPSSHAIWPFFIIYRWAWTVQLSRGHLTKFFNLIPFFLWKKFFQIQSIINGIIISLQGLQRAQSTALKVNIGASNQITLLKVAFYCANSTFSTTLLHLMMYSGFYRLLAGLLEICGEADNWRDSRVQQSWCPLVGLGRPSAFPSSCRSKWLTRSALSCCCSYYYYDYSYHHGEQITSPQASFFMAFLLFLPIELDKWGIRKLPF